MQSEVSFAPRASQTSSSREPSILNSANTDDSDSDSGSRQSTATSFTDSVHTPLHIDEAFAIPETSGLHPDSGNNDDEVDDPLDMLSNGDDDEVDAPDMGPGAGERTALSRDGLVPPGAGEDDDADDFMQDTIGAFSVYDDDDDDISTVAPNRQRAATNAVGTYKEFSWSDADDDIISVVRSRPGGDDAKRNDEDETDSISTVAKPGVRRLARNDDDDDDDDGDDDDDDGGDDDISVVRVERTPAMRQLEDMSFLVTCMLTGDSSMSIREVLELAQSIRRRYFSKPVNTVGDLMAVRRFFKTEIIERVVDRERRETLSTNIGKLWDIGIEPLGLAWGDRSAADGKTRIQKRQRKNIRVTLNCIARKLKMSMPKPSVNKTFGLVRNTVDQTMLTVF